MIDSIVIPEPSDELSDRVLTLKKASVALGQSSDEERKKALSLMAQGLEDNSNNIVEANLIDMKNATQSGVGDALLSRLKLNKKKLDAAISGLRQVSLLRDPIGSIQLKRELDDGLCLERITVPLGVLGVIFESRPDAVIQIASLAIRSGNAAILKGGSESNLTNKAIVNALKEGLDRSSISSESLCLLTTRVESLSMLKLDKMINLIIPRGSNELVRFISENTRIPVLGHADGICHLYIDEFADLDKGLKIAIDSKCQYPAACNAIETLLVNEKIASNFLEIAVPLFEGMGVTLLGDEICQSYGMKHLANESDWSTEYLDLKLSVKIVSNLDEAIEHIRLYGSRHTDAIVTDCEDSAKKFIQSVDSSGVYHNCSTRFADGFRYGFGAEVGISTQTLPPRGPVGLEGLVTYKYILSGEGHISDDFATGKKSFSHKDID